MPRSAIVWTQDRIADVPLRRFVGCVGPIEVGSVEYDGTHQLWTWWSPLNDEAWGHAASEVGAKQGFEVWLRGWLEHFRPLLDAG
ncbi:hypothetical protein [Methylobacterium oxalidis]|uniref:hypothetical protein n=1 Tax=Methylobacterium oxalidis TaxID=944322 RepID=UPI003315B861